MSQQDDRFQMEITIANYNMAREYIEETLVPLARDRRDAERYNSNPGFWAREEGEGVIVKVQERVRPGDFKDWRIYHRHDGTWGITFITTDFGIYADRGDPAATFSVDCEDFYDLEAFKAHTAELWAQGEAKAIEYYSQRRVSAAASTRKYLKERMADNLALTREVYKELFEQEG